MMYRSLIIILFFTLNILRSYSFDFIDTHFEGFINRVVAADHRKDFSHYYSNFMKKIDILGRSSKAKKNAELFRLRNLAFCSLENKHPEWALQLKPYALYEKNKAVANNQQLKSIRIFLTRYAAYEEFLKAMAQERAGIWYRFKSYSKHVSSKVVTFFNGFTDKKKKA